MPTQQPDADRHPRSSGRRPGDSGTRASILREARRSFGASGYRGTTIRGIARAAQVDPALVHHFYGSKDDLFAAAMALPLSPAGVIGTALAGDLDGLGERIVEVFVRTWDDPVNQPSLLGVLRALVTNDASADMARDFVTTQILTKVSGRLTGADRGWRTNLVGSQLVGLAMTRYLLRIEPLASASTGAVIDAIGPTLQRYLTGPVPMTPPRRQRMRTQSR